MRVLFIGDVFSTPGYTAALRYLAEVRDDFDFIIVNGENVAGGFGITRKHFNGFLDAGADVVTLGNHTWDAKDVYEVLEETPRLIRPLNYPPGAPGLGHTTLTHAYRRARDGGAGAGPEFFYRLWTTRSGRSTSF